MILRKSKDEEYYYCSSFVRNHNCTNHSIRKDKLEKLVLKDIKEKNSNIKSDIINEKLLNDLIDEIIIYDKNNIKILYK